MTKLIAKISSICWGFVCAFAFFLSVAGLVPQSAVWIVSALLGLIILALPAYNLYQIYRKEKFNLSWFLGVKIRAWQIVSGGAGLGLLIVGIFGTVFPRLAEELAEKHIMKFAAVLVILFWAALIFTFLGWELICLSESLAYWRLKKKGAFGSFALGIFWLFFVLLFSSLFLDVINDNFLSISSTIQNWILGVFAILSIITGLWSGKYKDLEKFAEEKENE